MERLSDQRPRPAQDHDARRRRVHPPLSPPRPASALPPHPLLRPSARPDARTTSSVRQLLTASTQPRERARRGRQRDRTSTARCPCCGGRMIIIDTFEGARPAQRHREPDQSTPAIAAAHLASQPRSLSSRAPEHKSVDSSRPKIRRPLKRQRQTRAMLPTEEARLRRWPRHNCAPSGCAPTHAICWRSRNPHRPRPTKQRPSSSRFLLRGAERRPLLAQPSQAASETLQLTGYRPFAAFKIGAVNGRKAQESGLRAEDIARRVRRGNAGRIAQTEV